MKTFSFISGNRADSSRGMELHIDRSQLPADMPLGLWLDDDGKAMPGLDRPARKRAAAGFPTADLVLLDRTRVRARLGPIEGVLTIEPGTRFDSGAPRELGEVSMIQGGHIVVREGRRFAELRAPTTVLEIDKRPNEFHVFTLEADRPPGARPGDRFRVDVVQTDTRGVTVGGLTVVFAFD